MFEASKVRLGLETINWNEEFVPMSSIQAFGYIERAQYKTGYMALPLHPKLESVVAILPARAKEEISKSKVDESYFVDRLMRIHNSVVEQGFYSMGKRKCVQYFYVAIQQFLKHGIFRPSPCKYIFQDPIPYRIYIEYFFLIQAYLHPQVKKHRNYKLMLKTWMWWKKGKNLSAIFEILHVNGDGHMMKANEFFKFKPMNLSEILDPESIAPFADSLPPGAFNSLFDKMFKDMKSYIETSHGGVFSTMTQFASQAAKYLKILFGVLVGAMCVWFIGRVWRLGSLLYGAIQYFFPSVDANKIASDLMINDDEAEGHGPFDNVTPALLKFTTLFAYLAGIQDVSSKEVGFALRNASTTSSFIDSICQNVSPIISYCAYKITGDDAWVKDEFEDEVENFLTEINEARTIAALELGAVVDLPLRQKIQRWYTYVTRSERMLRSVAVADRTKSPQIERAIRDVRKWYEVYRDSALLDDCRRCPVTILLSGVTGVGKTEIMRIVSRVCADVARRRGRTFEKDRIVFSRAGKSQYWDGYAGHLCYQADEWLASGIVQDRDESIVEFLNLVSTGLCPLNYAECTLKGCIPFTSDIVLIGTNFDDWKILPNTDKQAVFKRMHFPLKAHRGKNITEEGSIEEAWRFQLTDHARNNLDMYIGIPPALVKEFLDDNGVIDHQKTISMYELLRHIISYYNKQYDVKPMSSYVESYENLVDTLCPNLFAPDESEGHMLSAIFGRGGSDDGKEKEEKAVSIQDNPKDPSDVLIESCEDEHSTHVGSPAKRSRESSDDRYFRDIMSKSSLYSMAYNATLCAKEGGNLCDLFIAVEYSSEYISYVQNGFNQIEKMYYDNSGISLRGIDELMHIKDYFLYCVKDTLGVYLYHAQHSLCRSLDDLEACEVELLDTWVYLDGSDIMKDVRSELSYPKMHSDGAMWVKAAISGSILPSAFNGVLWNPDGAIFSKDVMDVDQSELSRHMNPRCTPRRCACDLVNSFSKSNKIECCHRYEPPEEKSIASSFSFRSVQHKLYIFFCHLKEKCIETWRKIKEWFSGVKEKTCDSIRSINLKNVSDECADYVRKAKETLSKRCEKYRRDALFKYLYCKYSVLKHAHIARKHFIRIGAKHKSEIYYGCNILSILLVTGGIAMLGMGLSYIMKNMRKIYSHVKRDESQDAEGNSDVSRILKPIHYARQQQVHKLEGVGHSFNPKHIPSTIALAHRVAVGVIVQYDTGMRLFAKAAHIGKYLFMHSHMFWSGRVLSIWVSPSTTINLSNTDVATQGCRAYNWATLKKVDYMEEKEGQRRDMIRITLPGQDFLGVFPRDFLLSKEDHDHYLTNRNNELLRVQLRSDTRPVSVPHVVKEAFPLGVPFGTVITSPFGMERISRRHDLGIVAHDTPSQPGDCGEPYFTQDQKMFGLHVAFSSGDSIFMPIYKEDCPRDDGVGHFSWMPPVSSVQGNSPEGTGYLYSSAQDLTGVPKSPFVPTIFNSRGIEGTQSYLPPLFHIERCPVPLDYVDGVPAFAKHDGDYLRTTSPSISPEFLDLMKKNPLKLLDGFFHVTQDMRNECRELTWLEVDNGIPGFIVGLDKTTSPGVFGKVLGKTRKELFVIDDAGRYVPGPELLSAQEEFASMIDFGQIPPLVCTETLKAELKPKGKFPRVFLAASVEHVRWTKRTIGYAIAIMKKHLPGSAACVGINPHGIDWNVLAEETIRRFQNVLGGDLTNCDLSCHPVFLELMFAFFNDFYCYQQGTKAYNNLRACVFSIMHQMRVRRRTWFKLSRGHPSGHYLTTLFNCIVVFAIHRWAYMKRVDERKFPWTEHVRLKVYGDDSLAACSDYVKDNFNMHTVRDAFAEFGMIYTDPDKNADMAKFLAPEQVTFLCRGFKERGNYMCAPLNKESIYGMLLWTRKSNKLRDEEQLDTNVRAALMESMHHGEEFFNDLVNKLHSRCNELGVSPPSSLISLDYLGFEEWHAKYYSGVTDPVISVLRDFDAFEEAFFDF